MTCAKIRGPFPLRRVDTFCRRLLERQIRTPSDGRVIRTWDIHHFAHFKEMDEKNGEYSVTRAFAILSNALCFRRRSHSDSVLCCVVLPVWVSKWNRQSLKAVVFHGSFDRRNPKKVGVKPTSDFNRKGGRLVHNAVISSNTNKDLKHRATEDTEKIPRKK